MTVRVTLVGGALGALAVDCRGAPCRMVVLPRAPSSSGLGHRTFDPATGVRLPVGSPFACRLCPAACVGRRAVVAETVPRTVSTCQRLCRAQRPCTDRLGAQWPGSGADGAPLWQSARRKGECAGQAHSPCGRMLTSSVERMLTGLSATLLALRGQNISFSSTSSSSRIISLNSPCAVPSSSWSNSGSGTAPRA